MSIQAFKKKLLDIGQRARRGLNREDVRAFLMAQYARSFTSRGTEQGQRWAGYEGEPKYAAYKRALGGGEDILRWKGSDRLYNALTKRGDSNQVWRAGADKAQFGARLPYASSLQRGGRGPFGERYPGRRYLALGPRARKRLAELLRKEAQAGTHPSEWRGR